MKALLVRVGVDQTEAGGSWNGPVNSITGEFVYIPIPESRSIRAGLDKPYKMVHAPLQAIGWLLPPHLQGMSMHLDPDFLHLTYGDQGERAKQIRSKLGKDDLLVFYAGLADTNSAPRLVYAIIGIYVIDTITAAKSIQQPQWDENAHTRRILPSDANDIVVRAKAGVSGRLQKCLPIGEFRARAYRVTVPLLKEWGGLSVRDGYLQRSARLPKILNAKAFYDWFTRQSPKLVPANN